MIQSLSVMKVCLHRGERWKALDQSFVTIYSKFKSVVYIGNKNRNKEPCIVYYTHTQQALRAPYYLLHL